MPILPMMPCHEGYEPPLPELNLEEGMLDISHDGDCTLYDETKIVAETLVLRCSFHPIPLSDKTIKVQLISEGEVLESVRLYDEGSIAYGYEHEVQNSQWQAIAFNYTGIGHGVYQGKTFVIHENALPLAQLNFTQPLYVKPFLTETQHYQERQTTLFSGQVLVSPPGALDIRVLRGYGGYYKEGAALEDIRQVSYTLTSTHNQTRVRLTRSEQPNFIAQKEETLTLLEALSGGYAQIKVTTDFGEIQFSSFQCELVPGHDTLVNVYFKP